MGKTLTYLAILAILGFGVYYFIFKSQDRLYSEKEANFTFRDTANIGKIFMVNNEGASILLERNASKSWTLNKKYPAMPIQMLNILTCLRLQTALSPVSDVEHDRVVKLLAGLATKVEVYSLQNKKIGSFYVGGQGPNYHGSYMIQENAQQAYLVEIPGFDGYLTPRFTVEENDWRSRSMINWPKDSISSVSINYPNSIEKNFEIQNINGAPVFSTNPVLKIESPVQTKRLDDYLGFFKNINAEGFLNGTKGLDSLIKNTQIRCILNLKSKQGISKEYRLFWIPAKLGLGPEKDGLPADVERMYAIDDVSKDTLLIQSRTFDKLLRVASDFYANGQ